MMTKRSEVVALETSVQKILWKTICILQIKLVSSKYVKSSGFFKMCVYWGWGWGQQLPKIITPFQNSKKGKH